VALVLLSLLLLTGCSSSGNGDGNEISGVVKYNGEPVPGGTISFISAADKNKVARAGINPDGTYRVGKVPLGDMKITIDGPSPPSDSAQGKKPPMILPKTYLKAETSGLSYSVKEGSQTHNIDLP